MAENDDRASDAAFKAREMTPQFDKSLPDNGSSAERRYVERTEFSNFLQKVIDGAQRNLKIGNP